MDSAASRLAEGDRDRNETIQLDAGARKPNSIEAQRGTVSTSTATPSAAKRFGIRKKGAGALFVHHEKLEKSVVAWCSTWVTDKVVNLLTYQKHFEVDQNSDWRLNCVHFERRQQRRLGDRSMETRGLAK